MLSRNVIAALVVASLTSGVALGLSTPTTMTQAPEPAWRSAAHDTSRTPAYYKTMGGAPVDLSPAIPVAAMRVAAWDDRQAPLTVPDADAVNTRSELRAAQHEASPTLDEVGSAGEFGLITVSTQHDRASDPFGTREIALSSNADRPAPESLGGAAAESELR